MDWAIVYHTEGPFEGLVDYLKRHGQSPEVFCDPQCNQLYIPGLQRGSIKCPSHFYIAVPRDTRLYAEPIVRCWIDEQKQSHFIFRMNTYSKALKSLFYVLLFVFTYYIARPYLTLKNNTYNEAVTLITLSVVLWTMIFIFLISKKPPTPKDPWDFTKPN